MTGFNSLPSKKCLYLSYGPSRVPSTFCITTDTSKRSHDRALMDLARRTKLDIVDPSDFYYLLHSRNVFCNDICMAI